MVLKFSSPLILHHFGWCLDHSKVDVPHLQVLQKRLEVLVSEVSGLGQTRLTDIQQLGRGLQQYDQAQRRGEALRQLWEELKSSIRTREEVQDQRSRCSVWWTRG